LDRISHKKGSRKRDFLFLALCISIVLFFIIYAGPFMEPYLGLKPIAEEIDRRDINAKMYFYTEVEQFSEAQVIMVNSRKYPTQTPD